MKDPIVEGVRKARQDHAQEFNHDLTAICNDLKKIEKGWGKRLISLPPKFLTKSIETDLRCRFKLRFWFSYIGWLE